MITVEENYIEVLDCVANKEMVINEIIRTMKNLHLLTNVDDACANYVRNYLKSVKFVDLLQIEAGCVYCDVRDILIEKFVSIYPMVKEENFENEDDWAYILEYFDSTFSLNRLYDVTMGNDDDSDYRCEFEDFMLDNFPQYIADTSANGKKPEEVVSAPTNPYEFFVDVEFSVKDDGSMSLNDVQAKVKRKVTRHWNACKVAAIVVTKVNDGDFKGKVTLHIVGNNTYTIDTIKVAVKNRLGADAKKHKWDECTIVDVHNV